MIFDRFTRIDPLVSINGVIVVPVSTFFSGLRTLRGGGSRACS
jgi:hypothetical protein